MDKVDSETVLSMFASVLYPMVAEQDGRQRMLQRDLEKMQKEHKEEMESDKM